MFMKKIYFITILFFLGFYPIELSAQTLDKVIEFLTFYPNKKAVEKDNTLYPTKAIFTPVITYAPETNLSLGFGMKGLFKMKGSGPETRTSNVPLTLQYTIENKYLFFSGFEVFFPQERYMLTGNVRVQSFPSLYFGIGQDTPESNKEEFTYSQVLIEPLFLKNVIRKHLFVGGGFRYNKIFSVAQSPNGLLENFEDRGYDGSTSTGIELAIVYDSRDNILNATEGAFIGVFHGFYESFLGGTSDFQLTKLDFRYFIQPFKNPKSIIGISLNAHFSHGDIPLLEQARLGGANSMRGYFEGRYTDRHLISGQIEWRQKLTGRWGLVGFAGVGTVAPSLNEFSMDYIRPSIGAGVRFLIDKQENLNLRLDYGIGNEKGNYYLKLAEAF